MIFLSKAPKIPPKKSSDLGSISKMFPQILQLDWTYQVYRSSNRNVTGVNSALMCFRQVRAAGQKYLSSGETDGGLEGGWWGGFFY